MGLIPEVGDHVNFWNMRGFRDFLEYCGVGDNVVYHSSVWFTKWTPFPSLLGRAQIVELRFNQ